VRPLTSLVLKIYPKLLAFYPRKFRAEFGDEMNTVFVTEVYETQRLGMDHYLRLVFREFRDWPAAVLKEYFRERKANMAGQTGFVKNKALTRTELLAALALFLIPPLAALLNILIENLPQWLGIILALLLFSSIIAATVLAIVKGLPRWFPPYMGALLTGVVFLGPFWMIWEQIYPHILRILGPMNIWSMPIRILYQGLMNAFLWLLVLLAGVILVSVLRIWQVTRVVWQRVLEDWTQLSFLIYGGVVLNIVFVFDEYQYDQPWKIGAWACLAVGCWLYLHSANQSRQIVILLCGATLAMWIVAVGKWFLVPIQDWPVWFGNHSRESERWFEAGRTLADWACIVITLLIPSLLKLLPRSQKSIPEETLTPA